jgi:uncharacterized membrane protein YagU involved in acid resistance
MTDREHRAGRLTHALPRAGARGALAAMAMTGLRRLSTTLGLIERTPPERVLQAGAPKILYQVPVERRPALVEAVHISYGTIGGAMFGLLPRQWRPRHRGWLGPAYGIVVWTGYELVIAPGLGLSQGRRPAREHLALLADHLLYGIMVAASPWPYRD